MDMKFRSQSGAIISHNPTIEEPVQLSLADPAAESGVGQVEPAHLLRKKIERVIREYSADPAEAALAVCVILESNLGLAEDGYFDNDEAAMKAILAADPTYD